MSSFDDVVRGLTADPLDASRRFANRHITSFRYAVSDLGFPSSGNPITVDRFLMVADDTSIERVFVEILGGGTGRGTLGIQIVQTLPAGHTRVIFPETTIELPPLAPLHLIGQSRRLEYGRSTYLRMTASPISGTTPWWTTATDILGSLHLLSD